MNLISMNNEIKKVGFIDVILSENRGAGIPEIIRVREIVKETNNIYTLKSDGGHNINIMGFQFKNLRSVKLLHLSLAKLPSEKYILVNKDDLKNAKA